MDARGWTGVGDPQERVWAAMDRMVAERERANRARQADIARGAEPGPEQYVPTVREVLDALVEATGRGMSYRDLTPLVRRYCAENDVLRRLPVRPRQRVGEAPGAAENGDPLPQRVRGGVRAAFGKIEAQYEALARVLTKEVALETAALRRRIADLELDVARLALEAAERDEFEAAADEARERTAALAARLEEAEGARRRLAELEPRAIEADRLAAGLAEASARAEAAEAEAARLREAEADLRGQLAEAVRRRDEASEIVVTLTQSFDAARNAAQAEVERAAEERVADRRTINELTALLRRAGLQPLDEAEARLRKRNAKT